MGTLRPFYHFIVVCRTNSNVVLLSPHHPSGQHMELFVRWANPTTSPYFLCSKGPSVIPYPNWLPRHVSQKLETFAVIIIIIILDINVIMAYLRMVVVAVSTIVAALSGFVALECKFQFHTDNVSTFSLSERCMYRVDIVSLTEHLKCLKASTNYLCFISNLDVNPNCPDCATRETI